MTRAGHEADADLLISHVRTAKGGVCTPKRIDFYERLPSTPLGKIDKKALRRRARFDAI